MQVILLERVAKLGQMGDVVKVRDGFARNFLLPQGKALRATDANKAAFEDQKAQLEARNLETKKEASALAEKLDRPTSDNASGNIALSGAANPLRLSFRKTTGALTIDAAGNTMSLGSTTAIPQVILGTAAGQQNDITLTGGDFTATHTTGGASVQVGNFNGSNGNKLTITGAGTNFTSPSTSGTVGAVGIGGHRHRVAAEGQRALVAHDDHLVAHRRHEGAAVGGRAVHAGDLRDALARHAQLVVQDGAELAVVGERARLAAALAQELAPARLHHRQAGQAMHPGEAQRPHMLLAGDGAVGAVVHRGELEPTEMADEGDLRDPG